MFGLDEFFARGGPGLYVLFFVGFIIWTIIIQKYIHYFLNKNWVDDQIKLLQNEVSITEKNILFVEQSLMASIKKVSSKNIRLLEGLLGMCPMLGLLGTVYGMIEVFDVLAVMGSGNPRAMSTGVAKATIPTMAGMTVALSGLYFRFDLNNRIEVYENNLVNLLDKYKK
jgi:biopolymer transport protein ExbB